MARMNGRERKFWYPRLIEKQHGEYCMGCGITPYFNQNGCKYTILHSRILRNFSCPILYIDHIDNDNTNNVVENLQLLCPSCNVIKNPKRKSEFLSRPKTPEMNRGDHQENQYRIWVNETIKNHDWVDEDFLIDAGAEYLTDFSEGKTISPVTTRRYLKKMTSAAGQYFREENWITFKFKSPQLLEWLEKVKEDKKLAIYKMNEIVESAKERFTPDEDK